MPRTFSVLRAGILLSSGWICGGAFCQTPPAPPAPAPPAASAPQPAKLGTIRFAQITDAHVFDAGYKCSGSYVEREYQENLNALRWSINEINRRWKNGERVDFVVFTGDLGIANLAGIKPEHPAPGTSSKCSDAGDPASSYGPVAQLDFVSAETLLANTLDDLPQGVPFYFVPGNNDLTDEDPASAGRYDQFVAGLRTLTHGRAADLNSQSIPLRGYTLIGLNSAGFKPQAYTDGTANEDTVRSSTVKSGGGTFYCEDLDDTTGSPRAKEKTKSIQSFAGMTGGAGPYLVFTHEPDLQDPYLPRRQNAHTASGGTCEFRSTWLLTKSARTQWQASGLNNPSVLGIFAGHFHSSKLSDYGGPQTNDAVAATNPAPAGVKTVPTYVTPPLAVKNQWEDYPEGARGMSFVTVKDGLVDEQLDLYWPGSFGACCGQGSSRFVAWALEEFHEEPDLAFVAAAMLTLLLIALMLFLASTLDPLCPKYTAGSNWIKTAANWIGNRVVCCKSQFLKLIVEGDTQSYSLSKLQFLLWTVATIYGYTYLWVAHTWVQGLPGLPDVTGKFPWETLLAGGTAVASQVSKQAFGTKGGGPLKPQLSDLISAGGVIAPGRIQFLSWTLVAVTAYLSSILASDPATIHLLPEIPQRLLEISGISAGAYLAARSVSPAGPLLTSASFTPDDGGGGGNGGGDGGGNGDEGGGGGRAVRPYTTPPDDGTPGGPVSGVLTVMGNYLSANATLQAFLPKMVDMPPDAASTASGAAAGSEAAKDPKAELSPAARKSMTTVSGVNANAVKDFTYVPPPFDADPKDGVASSPGFYTRLRITIEWTNLPKKWTLRLQNPDGKYAEIEVTMPAEEKG